ncbi:MAG: hypothetical protein U1F25_11775 [Rubrivivax sp.]
MRVRGEVRGGFHGLEIVHPVLKVIEPATPLPQVLTPCTRRRPRCRRRICARPWTRRWRAPLAEILPPWALPPGLPPLRDAVLALHHPAPGAPPQSLEDRSHPAWQRLKYEELLAQQLSQARAVAERAQLRAPALRSGSSGGAGHGSDGSADLRARLAAALPFRLTAAQERVVREIEADLALERPMHRLLQGDVGSGRQSSPRSPRPPPSAPAGNAR